MKKAKGLEVLGPRETYLCVCGNQARTHRYTISVRLLGEVDLTVRVRGPLITELFHFIHPHHCFIACLIIIYSRSYKVIIYKLSTLTYLHNNHPIWLASCIYQVSPGSSDHLFHNSFFVPTTKLNLGKCAFSVT